MSQTPRRTPLYAAHVEAGGRMVPFAGFELPVQYVGVIAESKAVRVSVGMFDVSHMARLRFKGKRALEYLEWVTTNDVADLEDRRGHYSLLPNESGGCVDDIITYRIGPEEFRMVVNAANHEKDVLWFRRQNRFDVVMEDLSDATAMIAVQGPRAAALLQAICDAPEELAAAPLFGVCECRIGGVDCFAARSGYTGEDGFELACPSAEATRLWNALLEVGATPCGLGSRDVLRVEAGLPLYGHELADDLSPIAAGLGWVISKKKRFIGSEIVNRVRVEGTLRKLQGVVLDAKRLLAPGMAVFAGGKEAGAVSSGVFSPALDRSIAFAFVDREVEIGARCEVDVRGRMEPGTVVSKRFLRR